MVNLQNVRKDLLAEIKRNPKNDKTHEDLIAVEGVLLREKGLKIPFQTRFLGFAWE